MGKYRNNIARFRLARGYFQRELAEKLGMYQPDYCDLENGHVEPKVYRALELARVLRCRVEDLFRDDSSESA